MTGFIESGFQDIEEAIIQPSSLHPHAVDVRIVANIGDKDQASEYASHMTYIILGASTEGATQILPQNRNRKRAYLQINPGYTDNNTTGFCIVGALAQMSARQGRLCASGNSFVVESGRALWLIGDGQGHGFTVSVSDELYMNE